MKNMRNMLDGEFDLIAKNETDHWWYRSLHLLVLDVLKHSNMDKDSIIVDAGCGTGGLLEFLKRKGYNDVSGFDISDTALGYCRQKKLQVVKGSISEMTQIYPLQSIDAIICNDAFYFLNKDEQKSTLNDIHLLLKDKGILIFNNPSLKAFSGIHDKQVGIDHRISIHKFEELFNHQNFLLIQSRYWPFFLSPFIWITRFIQRLKLKGNIANNQKSDLRKEPVILNKICFYITFVENKLMTNKPFGSSLFLVLKKINHV